MFRSISVRAAAALVAITTAFALGSASAAAAAPAPIASIAQPATAEGPSCSFPPAGWTFISISMVYGQCGSPYGAIMYNLRLPVDGLVACSGVEGWAITASRASVNHCALNGGTAFQQTLYRPYDGLWSCTIPKGWTYSQTRVQTNVCGTGQFVSFKLKPL